MAGASTPALPERVPWRRRRGAVPLLALAGAFVVLSSVAWYALAPGPAEPASAARDVRGTGGAGHPAPPDVDGPPLPLLGAGETATVAPPRSVAAPVREEDGERWSRPRSGATEPWLDVQLVDATTGAPLESAIVRAAASAEALAAQDERVASARADAAGIAKLWDPPAGLDRNLPWLLASAARHAPALLPVTSAVPTGTHAYCVRGRTIALPLAVARPLTVRVRRRSDLAAIAGARVVARAPWAEEADWFAGDRADSQLRRLLTVEGTTDAKGEFAFVPLARQPWRIHVAASGFDSEDLVLSAAQAQEGSFEVALRELFVAAVALPANGLSGCPSLQWDGTPAWYAPAAIQWIPDHLTPEERAAATASLARRPGVAEGLEPGMELRCRFATLHSEELAAGRPASAPAKVETLPGEEPVDVTLTFVPFERLGRDDVFVAQAPPIGGLGRFRLVWKDQPAAPARFVGELEREGARGDPIVVRGFAWTPGECHLVLPPGRYRLDGSIGGHSLTVTLDVREGDAVALELSRTSPASGTGYLGPSADRNTLAVRDPLGRPRLHYELTTVPSDVPRRRTWAPTLGVSHLLTRRIRYEPADPFDLAESFARRIFQLDIVRTQDLTIEAFGCVPASFPRVRLDAGPVELELALDETALTSW